MSGGQVAASRRRYGFATSAGRKICQTAVAAAVMAWGLLQTGCAVNYIDDDGVRHVVGFVNLRIAPAGQHSAFAGDVIDLSTVGLSISQDADGGHLAIGYSRAITGHLRDDALALGDPFPARATRSVPVNKEPRP